MTSRYGEARARCVVTGLDERGKSTIVSDGLATTRVVADAFTINQLWRADVIPPHVSNDSTLGREVVIPPPVRVAVQPSGTPETARSTRARSSVVTVKSNEALDPGATATAG